MTVLTLTRVPRRMFRKLAKPLALRLNAWRTRRAEDEVWRLIATSGAMRRAANREAVRQLELEEQRNKIAGW